MILKSPTSTTASTTSTPAARTAVELRCILLSLIGPVGVCVCGLSRGTFDGLQLWRWRTRRLRLRVRMRAVYDLLKVFLIFLLFEEVGDVKEGVALESDIDECGLHSRKNSRNATLVDRTRERVFVLTLKIDFGKLFVFHHRNLGFMRGS